MKGQSSIGSKIENQGNYKIILLKEVPKPKYLYHTYDISQNIYQQSSSQKPIELDEKSNTASIAYLSSILQDQNIMTQNSTSMISELQHRKSPFNIKQRQDLKRIEIFRKTSKKVARERNLSLILQHEKTSHSFFRLKTQSIESLIQDRKLMPINNLKKGEKNIQFTKKNREQLLQDFSEFVQKSRQNKKEQNGEVRELNTKIFSKRRQISLQRNPIKQHLFQLRKKKNKNISSRIKSQNNQSISHPKKIMKTQPQLDQINFAVKFRQMKNNFPILQKFGWSKVQQHTNFKINSAK